MSPNGLRISRSPSGTYLHYRDKLAKPDLIIIFDDFGTRKSSPPKRKACAKCWKPVPFI